MTPPPVDLNKLKSILGASKAIMNKVQSTRPIKESSIRVEEDFENSDNEPSLTSQPMQLGNYTDEMVNNSNLPPIVKKAMLEKRIPPVNAFNSTFSLEDVSDEKPMDFSKKPKSFLKAKPVLNETKLGNNMVTIDKETLNEMVTQIVNERLLEFFTKSYNKTITEDTIRKTIGLLIKEGKLPQKKKTL